LPAIAGFDVGMLPRARESLSGRPRPMAVWGDWLAGRGELRQLLSAKLSDPAAVRAEVYAVRKAGLDPDLPPPVLHRLTMISSLWGFSSAEAREYAEARASGDMSVLCSLLRRNRAFVTRTRREFPYAVETAFCPAPVPAINV
jgi:hypothetical protein